MPEKIQRIRKLIIGDRRISMGEITALSIGSISKNILLDANQRATRVKFLRDRWIATRRKEMIF